MPRKSNLCHLGRSKRRSHKMNTPKEKYTILLAHFGRGFIKKIIPNMRSIAKSIMYHTRTSIDQDIHLSIKKNGKQKRKTKRKNKKRANAVQKFIFPPYLN